MRVAMESLHTPTELIDWRESIQDILYQEK